jgi:hypothetical protein
LPPGGDGENGFNQVKAGLIRLWRHIDVLKQTSYERRLRPWALPLFRDAAISQQLSSGSELPHS